MKNADLKRVAYSPGEFATLFGKSQTWGYRQIYAGKVKTITEYGRILIPAAEVERILGDAGSYNGLKPKVAKRGNKIEAWRRFIASRRKLKSSKVEAQALPQRLRAAATNARGALLSRLTKQKP